MRTLLLLATAVGVLPAAVIRGVVVDDQTSRPLARAQVALTPIAPTPSAGQNVRTDRFGNFAFVTAAGAYVVKASRRGFISMEYGQKRWNSAGAPLEVAENASAYLTLRLPRFSGITGTLVDENDIGIPSGDVAAYRFAEPPQLVTRARADERGVFRLSGLEPGYYLVRSAAFEEDGISYVPTFSRETEKAAESRPVEVMLDRDATEVYVKPAQGRLFTLAVSVNPPTLPGIRVTLVSDMGRQTTSGGLARFNSLAPGDYEIFAETGEGPLYAAYRSLPGMSRDANVQLDLRPVQDTQILLYPMTAAGWGVVRLAARRRDLAGRGDPQFLNVTNGRATLAPGRWEVRLTPPPGHYVSGFSGNFRQDPGTRPEGWNEFTAGFSYSMRFTLSTAPATVSGIVKSNGKPVAGAPVILEPYDSLRRKRQLDLISTRADMEGRYRFDELAAGEYRIFATFEYRNPSSDEMEAAGARGIRLAQGDSLQQDLDLFAIR